MTTASSLHFGPEWMRKPSRGSLAPLSPNTTGNSPGTASNMLPTPPAQAAPQLPNVSSYSSLLTSASPPPQIKSEDENYPFRYSKEQLLRVWKDGGGRGGLGLEVERWPGIVREVGGEPLGVKEMTQEERKLFSTSVNSDPPIRRNTNALSLASDRQTNKLGQGIGIGLGPASPRGIGAPRRRGTANADDPSSTPFLPRKLSLSSTLLAANAGNNTPNSPGGPLPSPNTRTRLSGLDSSDATPDVWARGPPAILSDAAWSAMGARRRTNEGVGTRGLGNAAGTPSTGLGIGRGILFGSLANGAVSGNGSADEKTSPSASPGPAPVSNLDAIVPAEEEVGTVAHSGGDGGVVLQNHVVGTNMIYSTNGVVSVAVEPTEDFASIQWSYKDPTGQIQGPFTGATMQQWFEAGYFSDDLLIKRTTIDPDFELLRDFRRRAAPLRPGETHIQMFLSPLAPRAPPNLPPPSAHLRGNNTPPNPSPRLTHLMTGTHDPLNHGPMSAGINGGSPLANSPALSAARSTTLDSYLGPPHDRSNQNGMVGAALNEGLVAAGGAGLTNAALERKKREEFIQSLRERELAMGVGAPSSQTFGSTGPFGAGFIPNPTVHHPQYSAFTPGSTGIPSAFGPRLNVPMPPAPIPGPISNTTLNAVSPFPHNGPVLWSSGEQLNTSSYPAPSSGFDHGTIYQSVPNQAQQNAVWLDNFAPQEPTWENIPEQHDLPPAVEAAANIAEEPIQTPISDSHVHESPASLHPALPGENTTHLVDDIAAALEETTIQTEPSQPHGIVPESPVPESEHVPTTVPTEVSSSKRKNTNIASNKGKATTPAILNAPAIEFITPVHSITSPTSPPAAKAWATVDDDKSVSLSLREIQEAEARKAEARKAADRVAKAVAPPSTASDDSTQAVTASWGLPQVGARSTAPAPAPSANGAPAWTKPAATPAGKKSMKEIQEEEEKRKKVSATKEAQSTAAAQQASKRAYAESAKNVANPSGGAWTTVGSTGKPVASPAAVRQPSVGQATPAARTASGATTASSATRSSSSASTAQPSAKPTRPSVPDETPAPPSLDFLKWLKEALKGLNGVNVEEFMQMLLSFPLDPSPTVIEIISDSIYANSSTLDGRRFAAEFCQKRKADAAAARAKPGSAPGAKIPRASLADVVKTQPKPVQSEWGFKTVQKKAKGGRK